MTGCQQCNSVTWGSNFSVDVKYPTDRVKSGEYFNIDATINAGLLTLGATYQVCIYQNGALTNTQSVSFGPQLSGSKTVSFPIIMKSVDMKFNVSTIGVGIIYDACMDFKVFTVPVAIPTPIVAPGTNPGVTPGITTPGSKDCVSDDKTICVFNYPIKKTDLFATALAVGAVLVLTRKKN